jgi:hypothetical protein
MSSIMDMTETTNIFGVAKDRRQTRSENQRKTTEVLTIGDVTLSFLTALIFEMLKSRER